MSAADAVQRETMRLEMQHQDVAAETASGAPAYVNDMRGFREGASQRMRHYAADSLTLG